MRRHPEIPVARALTPVVAVSGASALVLQVVWQRIISMNSGVDLTASTTVVAGFLAGLGLGSVIGGWLADRLPPAGAVRVFAAANAAIAVFAWFSTDLFYDLAGRVAPDLRSPVATFGFNFVLLLVPTTLEGMSLPLVARIVSRRIEGSATTIGRLYGVNTLGAAAGAVLGGWYLMGAHGFVATTRTAAVVSLAVSLALVVIARTRLVGSDAAEPDGVGPHPSPEPVDVPDEADRRRARRWLVVFAVFGAVALAFQQVFFRLLDGIARSNSYSFSLVLAIYLGVWGLGSALGAVLLRRATDHRAWFLWLQFASGAVAATALVVFVRVLPHVGLGATLDRWFAGDGFVVGYSGDALGDVALFALGVPALLMGVPVLLLGAAYPFAQAIVADDLARIGRSTGSLVAANIAGSVGGTLLAGFVLIDVLGTAGTFRLLCGVLAVTGIVALVRTRSTRRPIGAAAVAATVALLVAVPGNTELWAMIVGADAADVDVAEDHSCASVFEDTGTEVMLDINGTTQNGFPFDDFHVLIGLLPALLLDDPDRTLAVGFGIGSTTYGLLAEPRVRDVTTVELCGGNYELARRRARAGDDAFARLFDDDRSTLLTGDGRHHLLVDDDRYDAIVIDTLRPSAANAGSHFSVEMYELARSHLTDDGVVTQWAPSSRVVNSAATVFPHLLVGRMDELSGSFLMIGSRSPIVIDGDELVRRFDALDPATFRPEQRASLRRALATFAPRCVTDGVVATGLAGDRVNRDLAPIDEYTLNHLAAPTETGTPSC